MPYWAKYDRANGRIVAISEADQAPEEDKLIAVIECTDTTRIGDFIGDDKSGSESATDAYPDLTPEAPYPKDE